MTWARRRITDDLAMRRKVVVRGSVKMNDVTVSESFRLRMVKNPDDFGNPAALKRAWK